MLPRTHCRFFFEIRVARVLPIVLSHKTSSPYGNVISENNNKNTVHNYMTIDPFCQENISHLLEKCWLDLVLSWTKKSFDGLL